MKSVRQQIYEIAATALDLPESEIRPDASWEEYGGDSLAVVEMVLAVQENFGIALETSELDQLRSLDNLVRIVEEKLDGGAVPARRAR